MIITYWSDYACPYCYIGEVRLKKAIASFAEADNIELEMKSFQLDPSAGQHATEDTKTRFARKYGISLENAGRQIEAISQLGVAEGLDFRYNTTRFTNTMNAHRLTKLAQSKNDPFITEKIIEALFKAYFTDNEELTDSNLLLQIGRECGLPADEIQTMLASDQYISDVLQDENDAVRYGIYSVPFFVIGKYGISGAQSVESMKQTISAALKENREVLIENGMSCDQNGCRIR